MSHLCGIDQLEPGSNVSAPVVRVLDNHSWLDDEAVKQLESTAQRLQGVVLAVGMVRVVCVIIMHM